MANGNSLYYADCTDRLVPSNQQRADPHISRKLWIRVRHTAVPQKSPRLSGSKCNDPAIRSARAFAVSCATPHTPPCRAVPAPHTTTSGFCTTTSPIVNYCDVSLQLTINSNLTTMVTRFLETLSLSCLLITKDPLISRLPNSTVSR